MTTQYNTRPVVNSSYNERDRVGIYYLLDVWDWNYLKINSWVFLYLQEPVYWTPYTPRPII
jgi:hypothetical protein